MFNKVIMVGNLTRDVELRYAQSGIAIAKSAIATNRKYKAQNGEQKEEVCFIDFTLFGRPAEIANQYLKKGSKVLLEGRLVLEQWNDQHGNKRSKHSIGVETLKMLGDGTSHGNTASQPPQQESKEQSSKTQSQNNNVPEIDIEDDEIPF